MKTLQLIIKINILLISFSPMMAQANWLADIFNAAMKIYNINLDLKQTGETELEETKKIREISQSQLDEMKKISAGLTGTHQYGSQYYDKEQLSWGHNSNNWQSILSQSDTGGGEGAVGSAIKQFANDYPINHSLGSSNDMENKYYLLQAQTALASRASAETAFYQMSNEQQTINQLHDLIDTTKDNKSAVDLNNRLVAENTLVNIEEAKLLAILVHALAIDAQEKANRVNENAEFFNIK